ncbi:SDR family oxidoreductase [Sphingobacterium lactis]|uniref:SDR family oxidoreductase n=1 Tax=Sphingobacterium lactis TaxID=797291 RepID=UPI003F81FD28
MNNKEVLLTGVSGFLGSHTAIELLNRGYKVTGTLRDLKRADSLRSIISKHTDNIHNLSFFQAELLDKEVWKEASMNKDYVIHAASPFPRELPKDENDLIIPAKEGTLNVLTAAKANNVKRVILVSSISTVVYGKTKAEMDQVFTEENWTDITNKTDTKPYIRSKTIAEMAAWDFMEREGVGMEMVSILPGAMLGPVLEEDFGTSANIVIKILDGKMPAMPKIAFEIVDVRSVAQLLVDVIEKKHAAGNRFMASSGHMTMKQLANVLKLNYPDKKIKNYEMPNFLSRFIAFFEPSLKPILLDLGITRKIDASKAKRVLGWKPITKEDAILDCAKSILNIGIIK